MTVILQTFTTPSNTVVVSDTAAAPGTLPTPAVFTAPSTPLINGNGAYIWSPNTASGQVVGFQSTFAIATGIISVALPISILFSFAGNLSVTVTSATLEVLNVLGIVIATIPLTLTGSNGSDPLNVATASADALLGVQLLASSLRLTVNTTVVAPSQVGYTPPEPGRFLGEIIVNDVVAL